MYSLLGVKGTHLFENILALTKSVLRKFGHSICATLLFFLLFMIMTLMVSFFDVGGHVLKGNLVLMIV